MLALCALAIPIVLLARALAVGPPLMFWRKSLASPLMFRVMTLGWLRHGISIALALMLPHGTMRTFCSPQPTC